MTTQIDTILALDVGERRIGVAMATLAARLPKPLATYENNEHFVSKLKHIIKEHNIRELVVGLPRSLDGNDTAQTILVRRFADELQEKIIIPIFFQDESVTSLKAREELDARGKTYKKEDIDALAATYILEDYLGGKVL